MAFLAPFAVQALTSIAVSAATTAIINAMTPPTRQQGPRLSDLKTQSSTYGTFIPKIFGTYQVAPTVLWIENNQIKELADTNTQGGKGGPSVQVTEYTYTATLSLLISQGEIAGVERLWADSVLIYDRSANANTNNAYATSEFAEAITVYTGTEDQLPHPRMEADHAQSPAYRGVAHIVLEDLILQKWGNRIPQFLAEVTTKAADVPYILESFDPTPFPRVEGVGGGTLLDRSFRPITANAGIIEYEGQGIGVHEVTAEPDPPNPPIYHAETTIVKASRSIDGFNVDETYVEIDAFATITPDYSFVSNALQTSSTRNATGWPHRFYRFAGVLKGDTGSTTRTLMSISTGYKTLETINAPDTVLNRAVEESYYYDGVIYFCTQIGGGEIGQYVWAVSEGGNMIAERRIEDYDETDQRKALKVFANQDGVYVLTSVGAGSDIDIVRYDHDLATLTGHWQDIGGAGEAIGLFATGSAAFFVHGSELCTFGFFGEMVASAFILESDTQFKQLGTLELGDLALQAAQPMSLGGGLFNVANKTVVCGNIFNGSDPSLGEVVRGLAVQAGISAADFDVSTLTDAVGGSALTSLQTMASNLRPLQMAYPFDIVESEWKIKCVRRGAGTPITITEDDLSARELNASPPDTLIQERENEISLPRQVNVKFQNKDRNFDIGEQHQSRVTTQSDNVWQVELPIASNDAEMIKVADVLMYASWLERTVFEFHLGFKHLAVEPTDVLNITLDNVAHSVRLAEIDVGRPGLMQCKGVAQEASNYQSVAVTQSAQPQTQIPIVWAMATKIDFLDIPLLRDEDEGINPGVYLAVYPASPGWKDQWGGSYIYDTQKTNTGAGGAVVPVDFKQKSFANKQAIYGSINSYTNLPIKESVIDKANTINITVQSGDALFSVDDEAFLSGANALVANHFGDEVEAQQLGADAFRYEILYFKNAVLEIDGSYTLSHFVRGLFGTPKLGAVDPEDLMLQRFWILEPDHLARLSLEESAIGPVSDPVYYKPITIGAYSIKTRETRVQHVGRSAWPLKPVHIRSYRNAAGDVTVRWIRRNRFGSDWSNNKNNVLNEETEEYALHIRTADRVGILRQENSLSSAEYIYSAADQIADFGSLQADINIDLYQLSALTALSHPALAGGRAGERAIAIV